MRTARTAIRAKPAFPGPAVPLSEPCLGLSGAITRVDPTGVMPPKRLVSGLPSVTVRALADAAGPYDISFNGTGNAIVTVGLGGTVAGRASLGPNAALLGNLLKVTPSGQWKTSGDVAAHEEQDPDGAGADSNGFGVLALPSRNIVADAGGNSLVEVRANGKTRTLAVFPGQMAPLPGPPPQPMIPVQAVPTSVAIGPDGYFYVGQLTGFPFPANTAKVGVCTRTAALRRYVPPASRPSSTSRSIRGATCTCSSSRRASASRPTRAGCRSSTAVARGRTATG